MNNTNSQTSQKSKKLRKPRNFAEALLETGGRRTQETKQQTEKEFERKQAKAERHAEVINETIYAREDEETKEKIKKIQEELSLLITDIKSISKTLEKAAKEEVVNPGTYHVGFFEAIKRFISFLRKKASEAQSWLDISMQRKKSQNRYQAGVDKSGTKFMLSQERTPATQSG